MYLMRCEEGWTHRMNDESFFWCHIVCRCATSVPSLDLVLLSSALCAPESLTTTASSTSVEEEGVIPLRRLVMRS
uniref:Secreted protein n=2 Tax=Caenorhabditis tropicalis TaxID=1561998 RepID=A0A1I7TSZ6_9PELO